MWDQQDRYQGEDEAIESSSGCPEAVHYKFDAAERHMCTWATANHISSTESSGSDIEEDGITHTMTTGPF